MNEEGIMYLSQLCNNIVQTQTYDKEFPILLERYSDFLLSSSSSSPNQIQPNENFQALIMVMSKLAITSYKILPDTIFYQIFRSIVAFNLHYFSISKDGYTNFVNEWPISFSKNYILSIFNNFYPKIEKDKILSEFSIASLLVYSYYSNNPTSNPFLDVFKKYLVVDNFAPLFDTIQISISASTFSVILFYTLVTQSKDFKSYCLSCFDTSWIFQLINNDLNSDSNEITEIRLNILLIFTEDIDFSNSISKNQNGTALQIINSLISIIKHFINQQKTKSIIVLTSLSIMFNISQKISAFDAQTSDSIFSLLNFLYKNKDKNDQFIEYINHLISLIEAISVHRMKNNPELIYAIVRQFEIIQRIKLIPNVNCKQSLDNLFILKTFLEENVIQKNSKVFDYNSMLLLIKSSIETWNIDGVFQVSPFPFFTYVSNELTTSLKFFRVIVLKEVQRIL